MIDIIEEFKKNTARVLGSLKEELKSVRANRPTSGLIENIKVEYYDQKLPLKQMGSISIEPPRDIIVHVWDKGAGTAVVKAIESASLGFSTSAEGTSVRVHLPELSKERREELVRHVKKIIEKYKIQVRHLRDEENKRVEKSFGEKEINEDQKFRLKEVTQKETDRVNKEIENLLENKIKEIKS